MRRSVYVIGILSALAGSYFERALSSRSSTGVVAKDPLTPSAPLGFGGPSWLLPVRVAVGVGVVGADRTVDPSVA